MWGSICNNSKLFLVELYVIWNQQYGLADEKIKNVMNKFMLDLKKTTLDVLLDEDNVPDW